MMEPVECRLFGACGVLSSLEPNNSSLAPTILPLALAAIGRMALVYNFSTTSADVVVQLDTSAISSLALAAIGRMALVSNSTTTSAIWPMAASARGEMVGARDELLGARVGCGPDLHCSQGQLWLLDIFGAMVGCGTYGPYLASISDFWCPFPKKYYLTNQMENAVSLYFLN